MDMEAIRMFLDVQRLGSITAASAEHYMTQSALGKRIASLEKELGVVLFQRGKGQAQVRLTPAGKAFSDIAERMLMLYDQAMELQKDAVRQYLSVACIRSAHDKLLPVVLTWLKASNPNLCVTVEEHHTAEILQLLEMRRVDIGITHEISKSPELSGELLYGEDYRVVLRKDNPFSAGEAVHPRILPEEHGIFQVFDQPFQEWFDQWWRPYSLKVRVNTTPSAERYFCDPEDWMIVPAAVAKDLENRGFLSCPLEDAPPKHYVYLMYHKHTDSGIVELFRKVAFGAVSGAI